MPKISLSTVLAVVGAAEPLVQDAVTIYNLAAPGLSASDLATAQAALARIQAQCASDYARVDAELAAAAGEGQAPAQETPPA